MTPEAACAPFRIIILKGEGAERPEEAALRTHGTELSVTLEGKADALQGRALSNRRDGLDEICCPKLGREVDADPGVDLEQAEAREVEAQSLEIALPEESVGEVGDDQLSCHRFLSPVERLSPHHARAPCSDRGYGHPSGRPRASNLAAY
jgi:hypothetical protein